MSRSPSASNPEAPEVPESLLRWPYATRQLLRLPRPELIEAHARNLLSRALNVGRLTAFVGSGASMAYGRMSWIDMLYTAQQNVLTRYTREICGKDQTEKDPYLELLASLLRKHHIERDSTADASAQLTVFQLSEELDKAISAASKARGKAPGKDFRKTIMWVTRDERGHAEQLLKDAFLDRDDPKVKFEDLEDGPFKKYITDTNKKQDIDENTIEKFVECALWGEKDLPFEERCFPLVSLIDISTLREKLINEGFPKSNIFYIDNVEKFFSSISSRYRLAAGLRSLTEKKRLRLLGIVAQWCADIREVEKRDNRRQQLVRGTRLLRTAIAPHSRDPLLILHRDLNIRRFLTTNYDHEIERLFEDSGYHRSDEGLGLKRSDSLGAGDPIAPMFREVLFSRQWTGELAALATSDRSRSRANWIVHLHGRAEVDGSGSLIVTEDDYQRHYVRDDERRSSIDDAVKLAFSAQPILFVGIGMKEVDLLRPLREFMGGANRLGDRLAVALLPAEGEERTEAAQKIDLLKRYGVYAIHYGSASMFADEKSQPGIRWLELIKKIKDRADKVFQLFDDPQNFPELFEPYPCGPSLPYNMQSREIREAIEEKLSSVLTDSDYQEFFEERFGQLQLKVPCTLETIPVEELASKDSAEEIALKNEVEIINKALSFICDLGKLFLHHDDWLQKRREAQSHRSYLTGAYTAINTACLCAALMRLSKDWKEWRKEWWTLPKPAPVLRDTIPDGPFPKGYKTQTKKGYEQRIKVLLRHAVDLPLNPEDPENSYKRFYAGAPSQTFYSFMSALEAEKSIVQKHTGRRIFLLVARRGVGKGHFFAALQPSTPHADLDKSQRLIEFLNVIGPQGQQWAGVAFFNFSFSLEVESVFDRLSLFLWECWSLDDLKEKERRQPGWDSLQNNRIERLRYAFGLYERNERRPLYRILIALNGISTMFDREGKPKNSQIQQLSEILIDNQWRKFPIDILFVCTENAIPQYFRKPFAGAHAFPVIPLKELLRDDLNVKSRLALYAHNELLKLNIDEKNALIFPVEESIWGGTSPSPRAVHGSANFVHLLHEARASVLMNSFFPVVALVVAREHLRRHARNEKVREFLKLDNKLLNYANFFDLNTAQKTRGAFKEFLGAVGRDGKKARHDKECLFKRQKRAFPYLMVAFAVSLEKSRDGEKAIKPAKIIRSLLSSHKCTNDIDELTKQILSILCVDKTSLWISEFKEVAERIDVFTKKLYEAVGSGRFALTVLMSAAYEKFSSGQFLGRKAEEPLGYNEVEFHAKGCLEFLDSLRLDLENQRESRRDDVLIERVLHFYKTRHEDREPLPLKIPKQDRGTVELWNVQQQILWHLAVISVPVEAEVLEQCPLIKKALHKCSTLEEQSSGEVQNKEDIKDYGTKPPSRTRKSAKSFTTKGTCKNHPGVLSQSLKLLEEVIKLLEFRCLVYRVKPRTQGEPVRYGVHRRLQRHIFNQMGAPFVEYPEVDQFSLTLYARQPDDIPRLSPTAHGDLRKTVAALSGYPEDNEAIANFEYIRREKKVILSPALRAAYGILRSVYSVSGVARFDVEHERIENELGDDGSWFGLGFFEEHRQQIRWVAEQAKKLAKDVQPVAKHLQKLQELGRETRASANEVKDSENLHAQVRQLGEKVVQFAKDAKEAERSVKDVKLLGEIRPELEKLEQRAKKLPEGTTGPKELRKEVKKLGVQTEQFAKVFAKCTPFYAGEIVWIYNECGVLSLVQGRLPDAFALFGLALKALDEIEPERDGSGPLRALVLMNQAIVDIERGRIRRASRTLESIIPSFSLMADEEASLIAQGYLGLTYHLRGNFDNAEEVYKKVTRRLVKLRKSRSASIFHRHYADLLRRREKFQEASVAALTAIRLAQEGSHEDVRHIAMLSEAKILIEDGEKLKDEKREPELIHSRLDVVERYARVMGIPQLMAEVHELRARLHFRTGDLRTAGSFARRSLEIASLHELQIRKASALVLYARINLKRGFKQACRPLLEEAMTIARDTEYFTANAQAQELELELEQAGNEVGVYVG